MRLLRLLFTCLIFSASTIALSEVPLSDDVDGMTCSFHLSGAAAGWTRRGGDWVDLNGELHGLVPFSSKTVTPSSRRQVVELDVTKLARTWLSGSAPSGAVFLRSIGGSRSGVVNFASRESTDPSSIPTLTVEWDDGDRATLRPSADSTINCTTIRSLGGGSTVSVGENESAILVFPLDVKVGRQIKGARLALTTDKQWGNGAEIGVFHVKPPWARRAPPRMGIANAYPGDQGVEEHPAVYMATGFESRNWKSKWSTYGSSSIAETVTDTEGNGFLALENKALRVTLIPSQNLGLDLRYDFRKFHGDEPEEAYFRYYVRFGENWVPDRDGGKLPGFAGTYGKGGWGLRKSDGTNGWSARGGFGRNHPDSAVMKGFVGIGSYVYHAGIEGAQSATWGWGGGSSGRVRLNQWYSIEQYVKMNEPGKADGVLRAWIDGELVFERLDLHFRDVRQIKIENVWFNVYHGGVEKPSREMSMYIDNVVIAREYIGPMRRK